MKIRSELITLRELVEGNFFFKIPIYQRLYVWQADQVRTLLEDLLTAFHEQKDIYYLGGIIVLERTGNHNIREYEIIDGQQRFTTLWMMSLLYSSHHSPKKQDEEDSFSRFCSVREDHRQRPRITFSIRPHVDRFFQNLMQGNLPTEDVPPFIVNAWAIMESFLDERVSKDEKDGFFAFVYTCVQMVLTRVPDRIDLNKLFEVINHRGVQLQHHEILKARLLSVLTDATERIRYAHLWNACAYMTGYVEKHLRDEAGVRMAELFDNEQSNSGSEALARADKVLAVLERHQNASDQETSHNLDDILRMADEPSGTVATKNEPDNNEVYESDDVRSIITFPLLLQHTLRIWLHKQGKADLPKILDKELLSLFNHHFAVDGLERTKVTSFIELLWEIRYLFDKCVIKWVNVGEEEVHQISTLYLNKTKNSSSLQRRRPITQESFALLQSMLYHSQQITTQYWLTPFLAFLHRNPDKGANNLHLRYLKHLDNHLFSSQNVHARPLIQRSWDFLNDPRHQEMWHREILDGSVLNESLGTQFPHYWFHKLEFVLWDTAMSEDTGPTSEEQRNIFRMVTKEHLKTFRITAKNSVEHISPQNPEDVDTNRVSSDMLNQFGNLALVSRSINSEYSNKPFNEKRQRFWNNNKTRLDSLKMALIYENESWNDTVALAHQEQMIGLMKKYLCADNVSSG